MDTTKNILVINAGSSSEKIYFYQLDKNADKEILPQSALWQTEINFPPGGIESIDWNDLLSKTLSSLISQHIGQLTSISDIDIVGYRVVHGGAKYNHAVIIDKQVKKDIEKYIPLAPLHNKVSLAQINALEKILPKARQIAVFDTAFHRTLSEAVSLYPVPYSWYKDYDIQRFGFHGINHQYCAKQAAHALGKDIASLSLIICHLGSGCSLAAVENGKSVNTTMGFTPLEGLMMASRSGSIDPSILLYLLKNKHMTADDIETALNKNSGLKGIAQTSNMKEVIEQMQDINNKNAPMAKLAFDMFISRLRAPICAMRASLSKLDALVFTAGIGENAALIREKTCAGLDFLGIELDKQANENINLLENKNDLVAKKISLPHLPATVFVIKAREDWAIAQQSLQIAADICIVSKSVHGPD